MNHDEWLQARKNYVTASQVAALMGEHPYLSLDKLRADKMTQEVKELDFPAVWWGQEMEVPNLVAFGKLSGLEVVPAQEFVISGPLSATLDGRIVGPGVPSHRMGWIGWHGEPPAEFPTLVEAKNTGRFSHAKWPKDRLPSYYWWQAQAQMHCARLTQNVLVAKVDAWEMHAYVIDYDEFAMGEASKRAAEFMEEILTERPW